MRPVHRILLLVGVAGSTAGCDQAAKILARTQLSPNAPVEALGGAVTFVLTENTGGFLSLGSSLPPLARLVTFILLVSAALAAVSVFLLRSENPAASRFCLVAVLVGGGLGNLIDRIVRSGRVTDFLILRIGPLQTGIFNAADVAVLAAAAGLVLCDLTSKRRSGTGPKPTA
jgi:signal peptidase II